MKALRLLPIVFFLGSASAAAGTLPPPLTMSIQIKDGDVTANNIGMATITAGGFKMVRKGIYWGTVEKTKGVYNFAAYDSVMNKADASGAYVGITLFGNNSLYESTGYTGITTEVGRQGFARFAAAAASYYKGRRVIYEIWNEPNLASFWRASSNSTVIAAEYAALVKAVVPAIRAADPSAYIVAGSISALWSASFAWFDEVIRQGVLKSGINGISVHPYGFTIPESSAGGYATIRSKMASAGAANLSVVNTEVGFPHGWIASRQGVTSAEAPTVQGWMLVRQQLVDLISKLGYSNWYELRDSYGSYGIVDANFNPLPAYNAARVMGAQLKGYSFVQRLTTSNSADYVLQFRNALGQEKLAAWKGVVASAASSTVTLPIVGTGMITSISAYGVATSLNVNNGTFSFTIKPEPQYIDLATLQAPVATLPSEPEPEPTPIPAPTNKNVALNRPVEVSSGKGANNLVDGLISTYSRWSSASYYPQTVTVDLQQEREISQLVYRQYLQRTSSYKVEVLSNGTWVTVVPNSANSSKTISASFTPIMGSKVRFTALSGIYYQRVYELEVFGH